MRLPQLRILVVSFVLAGGSSLVLNGQTGGNTITAHVTAARAAADDTWLILYSELCGVAMGAGGRASSVVPPPGAARGRQAGPPPREAWYHDPVKVFDNMYVFETDDPSAWAIQTSAGIIMIDANFDYQVKEGIVDAMSKVGLDPAQIKYVVVTHAHGDHSAGAKYLQGTYGARVLMSEVDWFSLSQPQRGGAFAGMPVPKKDMVIMNGQKLTLGDTTITMYLTPGHTMGTVSLVIPVKDKSTPHTAAFWGGTAINANTPNDNLVAYSSSARRFAGIAAAAGADVLLSNHARYIDMDKRIGANRANPAGPNAFLLNPTRVGQYMQVADRCAQAVALFAAAKK